MAGVLGNKNACGCGAKMMGNTNALQHGRYSYKYLRKRADRNSFMRDCQKLIVEIEEIIKKK